VQRLIWSGSSKYTTEGAKAGRGVRRKEWMSGEGLPLGKGKEKAHFAESDLRKEGADAVGKKRKNSGMRRRKWWRFFPPSQAPPFFLEKTSRFLRDFWGVFPLSDWSGKRGRGGRAKIGVRRRKGVFCETRFASGIGGWGEGWKRGRAGSRVEAMMRQVDGPVAWMVVRVNRAKNWLRCF